MRSRSHDEIHNPLPDLASRPQKLVALNQEGWDIVIRQARSAGILARLSLQLDDLGALGQVPERPRRHLEAARILALKHLRDVRWEIACIREVLAGTGIPIILLKGAAYVMAELPPSRGRLFGDIDFMVPRDRIGEVEEILLSSEWFSPTKDPYDQQYYRRWTHQIPPLQHYKRNTTLDVHHTIVEMTARSAVDASALADESRSLDDDPFLRVLAPADMVLHSALHLFNDGEFDRGLRDLLDLCDLLDHFGRDPAFPGQLAARAEVLGLMRPLFLMLRYRKRLLGLPVPTELQDFVARQRPSSIKCLYYDALFLRALLPNHKSCDDPFTATARWLLFVRAHYLRMPAHLLVPHLLRKAFHRPSEE